MSRNALSVAVIVLLVALTACGGFAGIGPYAPATAKPTQLTITEHSTAAGTVFSVETAEFQDDTFTFGIADREKQRQDVPLILYTHGAGGNASQFAELYAWTRLRDWVIDNGWAWVESLGGGDYSWGNQASRVSYENAYAWVNSKLNVGKVVVLGRSMGGIVACWLATRSATVSPHVSGLILNSAVLDLGFRYSTTNDVNKARYRDAFGVTDDNDEAFIGAIKEFDPIMAPVETWDDINVLQLIGTNDTTVPPGPNALALRQRWAGRPKLDLLDVRQGGDHSGSNGSFLQLDAMTSFLSQVVPRNG